MDRGNRYSLLMQQWHVCLGVNRIEYSSPPVFVVTVFDAWCYLQDTEKYTLKYIGYLPLPTKLTETYAAATAPLRPRGERLIDVISFC